MVVKSSLDIALLKGSTMKNDRNHCLQVETGQSYFRPMFVILAAIQHHLKLLCFFLELWSHALTAFSVPKFAMYW
jgi:hypothetical protein